VVAIERIGREELIERVLGEPEAFLAALAAPTVLIVEGFHPRERVLAFRELALAQRRAEPPSWHACLDGVPDYHRIVDDYPKAWVKSRMHAHYFHRFNGNAELFAELRDVFALKNALAGEPEDAFLDTVPSDGVIARVVSNHYPRGGGYQAEHVDPASRFARIQTIIQASEPGVDFATGGLYVRESEDAEPVAIDPHSRIGDLLVLSPDVRHGVAPVDPHAELDWDAAGGRWMIMPIVIRSDHEADAGEKPRQVA
jgi:hypothetical protein